jgi:hypothetical protein
LNRQQHLQKLACPQEIRNRRFLKLVGLDAENLRAKHPDQFHAIGDDLRRGPTLQIRLEVQDDVLVNPQPDECRIVPVLGILAFSGIKAQRAQDDSRWPCIKSEVGNWVVSRAIHFRSPR